MGQSKRVTLRDIAEELNLTKVSISKALRDHPDISSETKKRVREMARKMGYAPNRLARSLTLDRTGTLGVIVPKLAHTFFADVLAGVNQVASNNDYELVLCVSNETAKYEEQHLRTLFSMQVDGLLVSVSEKTSDPEPFLALQKQGVPIVFFDRHVEGIEASRVTVDDYGGAYQATQYAVEHDGDCIAHVAGYSHINIGRTRRKGYEDALQEHGVPVQEEWVVEGGFAEKDGYYGFKELLNRDVVPDAVFAVTFPVALGITDAMRTVAPELQEKIQIYSFGQHGLNRFFKYPHVSVYQPAYELGVKATSLMMEEINSPDLAPRHVELPTRLVDPTTLHELSYLQEPLMDGAEK